MSGKTVTFQAAPTPEYPNGYSVPLELALHSEVVKDIAKDFGGEAGIPANVDIPVTGGQDNNTIANLFNYVQQNLGRFGVMITDEKGVQVEKPYDRKEELSEANKDFFNKLIVKSQKPIFDLMLAVNYLNINLVVQDIAKFIATELKGKSSEEMRKLFTIPADELATQLEGLTVS